MTKDPQFDDVADFNTTFGHAVRDTPSLDHEDIPLRLVDVFLEETIEVLESYLKYLLFKAGAAVNDESTERYLSLLAESLGRTQRVLGDFVRSLDDPEVLMPEVRETTTSLPQDLVVHLESKAHDNMVLFLDGLADTKVTLYGLAQATGMPILEAHDIAHASNMSKLGPDKTPLKYPEGHDKAGKTMKGPDFWDPKEKFAELLDRS